MLSVDTGDRREIYKNILKAFEKKNFYYVLMS